MAGNYARINLEIPTEVKKKVMQKCIDEGENLSKVIRRALYAYISEEPTQDFLEAIKAVNLELLHDFRKSEIVNEEQFLEMRKRENDELARRMDYFAKTQARIKAKAPA